MTPNKSLELSGRLQETMKQDMIQCLTPVFPSETVAHYATTHQDGSVLRRDRIYTTENTLFTMIITSLHEDKSLQHSVDIFTEIFERNKISAQALIDAENKKLEEQINKSKKEPSIGRPRTKLLTLPKSKTTPVSTNTAAYSKARNRIDLGLITSVFEQSASFDDLDCAKRWHGRLVFNTDGTYFQMQDTQGIGEKYRTQKTKSGSLQGYPQGLIQVLSQQGTGLISAYEIAGRDESELDVMSRLLPNVPKGSVILADDLYNSFSFISLAIDNEVDLIVPDKKDRKFEVVKEIAPGDQIVKIKKNPSVRPLNDNQTLPETLLLRRISYKDAEHPDEDRVLLTTIHDESIERQEFIHQYATRWDVEITIREIKTIMGINIMRSKTEKMVFREMGVALLSYNLLRKIVAKSSKDEPFSPEKDIFQELYSVSKNQLVDRKGRVYSRWSSGRPITNCK